MSTLRDTAINDLRVIANETLTNSAIYFGIMATGLDDYVFKASDPMWMTALKSGLVSSAVNVAGSNLRQMWPQLNFFSQ